MAAAALGGWGSLATPPSSHMAPFTRRSVKLWQPRLQVMTAAAADSGGSAPEPFAQQWDRITNLLVTCSSIPFSVLVLPQVASNFAHMAAGNMSALSVISWEVGTCFQHVKM